MSLNSITQYCASESDVSHSGLRGTSLSSSPFLSLVSNSSSPTMSPLVDAYEGDAPSYIHWGTGVTNWLSKQESIPRNFGQAPIKNNQDYLVAKNQTQEKPYITPLIVKDPRFETIDSAVIQVWEGSVIEVDRELGVMQVFLNAKMGHVTPHTGEIELQWVSEQDIDLVRPGAIFYLTLFKRKKRSGIENAQELRFRRRPSWTKNQVAQVERDAKMILSKMKARPIAE